ncbi:hypothetical protein HJFPF1_03380 [Paramyrothecium foliicola]|nr:hypothetical protein HJFPF1_03380 [Paramyrothecium foliicola]
MQQGGASVPESSQKRKRSFGGLAEFSSSRPSHLPQDSINPFSYTPSTLAQLSLAGLADTDEDPTRSIPDFPHRGFNRALAIRSGEADTDAETDAEDKGKAGKSDREATGRESHFDILLKSVHHFLDQGDLAKAARTYGLILQLRPKGLPVDIRHHRLWAIGAEILLREGEEPPSSAKSTTRKRLGSAANMGRVKVYYETLIQQHPYDYKRPNAVSAVDFWMALLNCEVYNVHVEHEIAVSRLDEGETIPMLDDEPDDASESQDPREREPRVRRSKDRVRLQALRAMRDITTRLDGLLQEQPYAKSGEFLRLRAMCSLYIADLVVPVVETPAMELEQAEALREREQHAAQAALQKMVENGGELDHVTRAMLGLDTEEDDTELTEQHSSLPIREA